MKKGIRELRRSSDVVAYLDAPRSTAATSQANFLRGIVMDRHLSFGYRRAINTVWCDIQLSVPQWSFDVLIIRKLERREGPR